MSAFEEFDPITGVIREENHEADEEGNSLIDLKPIIPMLNSLQNSVLEPLTPLPPSVPLVDGIKFISCPLGSPPPPSIFCVALHR